MKPVAFILLCISLAWAQRPSDTEADALLGKSRERALSYSKTLPDFVCTEVIHRFIQNSPQAARAFRRSMGSMNLPPAMQWSPLDKLTVKLSYYQQREDHKLVLVDNKPTVKEYLALSGGITSGEFGQTLQGIFDPATHTSFQWEGWKTVRRHRAAVFAYQVDAAHSRYEVVVGAPGEMRTAIVPFHGTVEIDRETGEVLQFTYVTGEIPQGVEMDEATTTVEYDFADVGGRNYLLPWHCETEIHSRKLSVRNDMDFREYRKFSADSSIEFGAGK